MPETAIDKRRPDNRHLEPSYFRKIDLGFFLLIVLNAFLFNWSAWYQIPFPIFISKYSVSLQRYGFSLQQIQAVLRSVNAGFLIDVVFFVTRLGVELKFRQTILSQNNAIYAYIAGSVCLFSFFALIDFTNGSSLYELSVARPMFINILILGWTGLALATVLEKAVAQQLAFYK